MLAMLFQDGTVFYDTALDIFINHSILYANTTLQSTFNYFPMAYFVTLPQIWFYYQLHINSETLLRLVFKLPIIVADLLLASFFSDKALNKFLPDVFLKMKDKINPSNRSFNNFELFILFNPVIIYIVGMTNQIDVFPALLLVITWFAFKNEKYHLSGITVMMAFLIKEYAIFLLLALFFAYLKTSFIACKKFIVGNLLVVIPLVGIASYINFTGFINHAILYQLFRQPAGPSIFSFTYELGLGILPSSYVPVFTILINIFSFGIIFLTIVYSCFKIFKNPTDKNIISFTVFSFLIFCIFNKVFWPQYLVSLLSLWLLYRIEIGRPLTDDLIYWIIIVTPIFLLYRSGDFATQALVFLLGIDFFTDLILIAFSIHFILLFLLLITKRVNLKYPKPIIVYVLTLAFITSQIYFQWYIINLPNYALQSMP